MGGERGRPSHVPLATSAAETHHVSGIDCAENCIFFLRKFLFLVAPPVANGLTGQVVELTGDWVTCGTHTTESANSVEGKWSGE